MSIAREIIPIFAITFGLFSRARLIVQSHGMLEGERTWATRFIDVFLRRCVLAADEILALTGVEAAALDGWARVPLHQVTVLGNPVPPTSGINRVSDRLDVLFLARLHPRKRVDSFIGAARYAADHRMLGKYAIVGPDQGDLPIVERAMARGASNVTYEGAVDAATAVQRVGRCSVFVMTSSYEPWGNSLALALTLGKPVVVVRSAALAPLVSQYSAGCVVPDGDDEGVARGIHRLLEDEGRYADASEGALRLSAEHFNADALRRGLLSIYDRVSATAPPNSMRQAAIPNGR